MEVVHFWNSKFALFHFIRHLGLLTDATVATLQGSVATYVRCGGVVDKQIKKGLLLSLLVKKNNRWIFGKLAIKNVAVSCTFFIF